MIDEFVAGENLSESFVYVKRNMDGVVKAKDDVRRLPALSFNLPNLCNLRIGLRRWKTIVQL